MENFDNKKKALLATHEDFEDKIDGNRHEEFAMHLLKSWT